MVSPEYHQGASRIQPSGNGAREQQRRQQEAGSTLKARGNGSFGSVAITEGYAIHPIAQQIMIS
jgi:hypothetical protein